VADLVFFIVVKRSLPEWYEWIINSVSSHMRISLEVTRSLFVIAGFAIVLICVPVIFYFVYGAVKRTLESL